jgi:hypothetical protein
MRQAHTDLELELSILLPQYPSCQDYMQAPLPLALYFFSVLDKEPSLTTRERGKEDQNIKLEKFSR